jgi:hypothetical protein
MFNFISNSFCLFVNSSQCLLIASVVKSSGALYGATPSFFCFDVIFAKNNARSFFSPSCLGFSSFLKFEKKLFFS